MLFGLVLLGLAVVIGLGLDYSRVTHTHARVAAAADSAALAAGRALLDGRLSDDEVKAFALDRFNASIEATGGLFGTLATPTITVDRAAGTVDIDVSATVPMTLAKVAGVNEMTIPIAASTAFDKTDVEVGLALDVTGSMGGQKISDLKLAAKDLVDILIPDGGTTNSVRIGLAPYATSINAGSYGPVVTGNGSADCVYERGGAEAFTDAEPVAGSMLGYNGSTWCPSAEVYPITDNKAELKSRINGFTAAGWTAGHLGVAWAWYLVSPEWASIWPASSAPVPYGTSNTVKVVVLMTDGRFNTAYVGSNGNSGNQARALCTEMKNDDVVVYSVAFKAPSSAQALLKDCSSSPDTYFPAKNGTELRAAFQSIARNINKLRITR